MRALHGHIRDRDSGLGLPTTGTSCCTLHSHRERETRLTGFTSVQEVYLAVVIEILQSIRQSDMSPILSRVYSAPGGTEALDVLMKYMYVLTILVSTSTSPNLTALRHVSWQSTLLPPQLHDLAQTDHPTNGL